MSAVPERVTIFANIHGFNPNAPDRGQLGQLVSQHKIVAIELEAPTIEQIVYFSLVPLLPKLPSAPPKVRTRRENLQDAPSNYLTNLLITLSGSNAHVVLPDVLENSDIHREDMQLISDEKHFYETLELDTPEDFHQAMINWKELTKRRADNMRQREEHVAKTLTEEITQIHATDPNAQDTLLVFGAAHHPGLRNELEKNQNTEVQLIVEKGVVFSQEDQVLIRYRLGMPVSETLLAQSFLNDLLTRGLLQLRLPQDMKELMQLRKDINAATRGLSYKQIEQLLINSDDFQQILALCHLISEEDVTQS